jgi:hypothetical protein
MDIEVRAPHQLKQRSVISRAQPKRDASRVGETHLQRIDRRMLRLFGIGRLQLVSGRAPIPEVSAEEQALYRIVVEHGERV